jgi:hypothetical protein
MTQLLEPADCPECGSAGAFYSDFCQVCYADVEVGEVVLGEDPPSVAGAR